MATTIALDRPRTVLFDIDAMCDIEDHFQAGLSTLLGPRMGFSTLTFMLWRGLTHEDAKLDPSKVRHLAQEFIKQKGIQELSSIIQEALVESGLVPKAKGGQSSSDSEG